VDVSQDSSAGRGVLVVDRRPLERSLVRFILQENGFEVTGEAATPADALRAVERQPPGVVVLHENAAWEQGQPTIPRLHQALPDVKVLVIAPAFGVVRVELLRDADAVLEEGVGFKDLPFVIGKLSGGDGPRIADTVVAGAPVVPATPLRRERWVNRFQGATAAAVVFLALIVARAALPPSPEPVGRATIALTQARHRPIR
jgi:CheY-like chemotaxis protein